MAGEPDLKVDYTLLATSARQLSQIRREFNGLEEWKQDIAALLGDQRVQDAMGAFVDNWDHNRKRLVEEVETVGKMIKTTSEAFSDLDDTLAKADKRKT